MVGALNMSRKVELFCSSKNVFGGRFDESFGRSWEASIQSKIIKTRGMCRIELNGAFWRPRVDRWG